MLKHVLQYDRAIVVEGWLTSIVGPFDTLAEAEVWHRENNPDLPVLHTDIVIPLGRV